MDRRCLLALLLVPLLTGPAAAGILFGKKGAKPTPAERVPELIKTLQTDGDENKRSAAAEELRQYDPAQFPDMVPALIELLLNDKKPGVRAEAAQSLGKLRPVNQAAGAALEQALSKDSSMRVRLQARSSLLQYRWAGYSSKVKDEPLGQTKEPPLADEPPPAAAPRLTPVPAPLPPRPLPSTQGPDLTPPPAPPPVKKTSKVKEKKPAEERGPDLN